jgi:hypothetical protein
MPLEGEMEDFDEPEELQASVNPIPTENDAQQTPTPIPESIFEEDKAIALWLSDPEDDRDTEEEDRATTMIMMNGAGTKIGNAPVEGERGSCDERVDNEGNQPIPQPAEFEDVDWPTMPQIEDTPNEEKLPLAQLEEQGGTDVGKVACRGSGEGVDEANEAIQASATTTNNPLRRRKVNLEPETGRRKVKSSTKDDAKSILREEEVCAGVIPHAVHPKVLKKPPEYYSGTVWDPPDEGKGKVEERSGGELIDMDFNDAEPISTPMDPNETLSEGQPLSLAEMIVKIENLPHREGIGPLTHTPKLDDAVAIAIDAITPENREEPPQVSSDKSRGGGGASWVNPRKKAEGVAMGELEELGGMRVNASKRDSRSLQGKGDISLVSGEEKDLLPDQGGLPAQSEHQTRSWNTQKGDQCDVDEDRGVVEERSRGSGRDSRAPPIFGKRFPPPLEINKPAVTDTRARDQARWDVINNEGKCWNLGTDFFRFEGEC